MLGRNHAQGRTTLAMPTQLNAAQQTPVQKRRTRMISPRSNTIDGLLRRSAAKVANRTALTFDGRSWTYRQIDDAVTRVATHLLTLGLNKGERVAAYGINSDAYVIGFLACARAGLIHVPINYTLRNAELAHILNQSGCRAAMVDPDLLDSVHCIRDSTSMTHIIPFRDRAESILQYCEGDNEDEALAGADSEDLAQLLYTSGTTSRPKGAMMTHRALVHHYASVVIGLRLSEHDRPLICMPLYHSAAMHVFMLPYLSIGATITLIARPDIPSILERLETDQIGSLFLAPTVWVPLAAHPDLDMRDLSSLRKVQYGASAMPRPVLNRLRERLPGVGFYHLFGQSEIGGLSTVLPPEEHSLRPQSCGRALWFVETRVVDENANAVPLGAPGEIQYRSSQLCEGYWDNPSATAEAFDDGWFRSGDLVTQDEDGFITVVDRIKDVINTGGVLVAPREIEDVIYTHPSVAEVAVVGTADDRWIEAITAVVVLKAGWDNVDAASLRTHVRSQLAPYKVPKKVIFATGLPRNESGKILKRELRATLAGTS
jgi:fatty-acyl-CoA synthase